MFILLKNPPPSKAHMSWLPFRSRSRSGSFSYPPSFDLDLSSPFRSYDYGQYSCRYKQLLMEELLATGTLDATKPQVAA